MGSFLNIMASPGAGKNQLDPETIQLLSSQYKIGVIEGDTGSGHHRIPIK